MNAYLAGPMRGHPLYNLHAFANAAWGLRELGHDVFNPIERDLAFHGLMPHLPLEEQDFDLVEAMRVDLEYIVSKDCDALILLPGWEKSQGCQVEALAAHNSGKSLFQWDPERSYYDPITDFDATIALLFKVRR